MKTSIIAILATYLLATVSAAALPQDSAAVASQDPQKSATKEINKLQKQYNKWIGDTIKAPYSKCKPKDILRRQEWGSLSKESRRNYIKAVQCLQKLPPRIPKSVAPGARSRYDDFSATHIMLTPNVHFDGLFLPFHRQLVWYYEKALRDECGYKGAQPYWDWTISWEDPSKSTVFDGSPYSMGSNGRPITPHPATNISAFGIHLTIPPGTGGGCVYSGPFQPDEYTVTLGPVAFEPRGPNGGLGHNPRCLTRDLAPRYSALTRPTDVLDVVTTCTDIGCFDEQIEKIEGVHTNGHFTMGGLGIDAYSAASDPAFWLHHAQVDRVWSLWQGLDPRARLPQTSGTGTAFNVPPSANITLDTLVDFGILGAKKTVDSIKSTIEGDFCYEYV